MSPCSKLLGLFEDLWKRIEASAIWRLSSQYAGSKSRLSSKPAVYRNANVFDVRLVYLISIGKFNELPYE